MAKLLKDKKMYLVIAGIAIAALALWYFSSGAGSSAPLMQGVVDPVSGNCIPPADSNIAICCYDLNKQPMACGGTVNDLQAILTIGGVEGHGVGFIQPAFSLQNTGSVDLEGWVSSVTCKTVPGGISDPTCQAGLDGSPIAGEINKKGILMTDTGSWSVDAGSLINIQLMPTGDYEFAVEMCAQDVPQIAAPTPVCKTATQAFTVTTETVDFTVGIQVS